MATISETLTIAREYQLAGRLLEAEEVCRQVLRIAPDNVPAWNLLGAIALDSGRFEAAADYFGRAVVLAPELAETHSNLGTALQSQGKHEEAAACHRRAVALNPDYVAAHYNLGNALRQLGRCAEAIACYERALQFRPGFAEAENNLGLSLYDQGRLEDAITFYQQAIRSNPDYVDAYVNVGNALKGLGRANEALGWYDRALELKPNHAEAHHNLGSAWLDLGHLQRAVEYYERALALNPNLADAHSSLSQSLLLLGDFERGWQGYEWRWRTGELPVRDLGRPRWNGEAVEGKTVLVWAEQGLGDTIQFVRYLKMVKERGARVVFECQRALGKLLGKRGVGSAERGVRSAESGTGSGEGNCSVGGQAESAALGIDQLVVEGEALPKFDVQAPLVSLPGIFQTKLDTIPAEVPYLFADAGLVEEWREKVRGRGSGVGSQESEAAGKAQPRLLVGINWRGRGGQGPHRKRDIPVGMFERLARVAGVRLVSLQKEAEESNVESRRSNVEKGPAIVDLGQIDTEHGAFMDTAAIMMNLDLVITSDTSVAHLAGALGVPVWVALPFVPDWRWLLDRNDSPWYPTMRLFRQKQLGEWEGVFEEMEVELRERRKEEGGRREEGGKMTVESEGRRVEGPG